MKEKKDRNKLVIAIPSDVPGKEKKKRKEKRRRKKRKIL